ncbi:3 exoribonuclease [Diplodia corticola]|uniref:Ribosomal RNA-processing protein 43 n=1 Tax=Diplodia corticola TaxID=236234 RepID=A0A1J9S5P9_9PEZI|nr:3 exoribonuclease [Diplodia corticola]OJD35268.1 3 exoribonuclease [Diplodia corticola]
MAVETAAPSANGGAPQLSFPRDIFAALSPAPFLLAHLDANANATAASDSTTAATATRPNGRAPTESRAPTINTGSLTHCAGSAVVRAGDTAVVCGVRAEILKAADVPNPPRHAEDEKRDDDDDDDHDDREELERLGLLVPNVELATGATPALMPGQPPSQRAQALTSRLLGAMLAAGVVRAGDLRVVGEVPRMGEEGEEGEEGETEREVKAYWALYVDVLFISLDGNAWDAAWAAVVAALKDTVLPRAWWDADMEAVLCSDRVEEARRLRLRGQPVALTCAVFEPGKGRGVGAPKVLGVGGVDGGKAAGEQERAWVLADPDAFEETNCQETVSVLVDVVDGHCVLHGIEKSGGGVVGRDVLHGVVGLAEDRWKVWDKAFSEAGGKS